MGFLHAGQSKSICVTLLMGILAIASGCNNRNSSTAGTPSSASSASATNTKFNDKQILSNFADQVVIPTNQLFAKKAKELADTVDTLVKNPSDQTLKAAQEAWVAARSPWEQTESFGFGPAESLGYDGALDTWPVNQTDLAGVLKSNDKLTPEYVEKLKETEKGFHVIEYLLFGENKSRKPSDFDKRQLEFLQVVSANFAQVASNLSDAWSKGVQGKPAYRQVLATAGDSGNGSYPSLQAGGSEIVGGMVDSLSEVADKKIGKPLEQKDPKLFESRFSFNTLTDVKNNVKGSQNAYLGQFPDANTSGKGLSAYIVKVNPELDTKVKSQFQAALAALDKIPDPIEKAITEPQAAPTIKTAKEAVNSLQETLDKEVQPLVGEKPAKKDEDKDKK